MADQTQFDQYLKASFKARNDAELTEVGLQRRAQPLAEAFKGRLPLARELADINDHFGVEVAQTVFTMALDRIPAYAKFIRRVRSFDLREFNARSLATNSGEPPFEITIIASGLPIKGRSENALSEIFERWRTWARSLGFTTDVIHTDPDLSLRENAKIISTHLISHPHPKRILLTYGSGASEFRALLTARMGLRGTETASDPTVSGELESIRAWINLTGAYNGASFARLQNQSRFEKFKFTISQYFRPTRASSRLPFWRQLDPRLPAWRTQPVFPSGLQVINVIGFPLRTEVPMGLMVSHEQLSRELGPNDGAVGVFEAIAHPGLIVPIMGMSHKVETLKLEPVLKRVLAIAAADASRASTSAVIPVSASSSARDFAQFDSPDDQDLELDL